MTSQEGRVATLTWLEVVARGRKDLAGCFVEQVDEAVTTKGVLKTLNSHESFIVITLEGAKACDPLTLEWKELRDSSLVIPILCVPLGIDGEIYIETGPAKHILLKPVQGRLF